MLPGTHEPMSIQYNQKTIQSGSEIFRTREVSQIRCPCDKLSLVEHRIDNQEVVQMRYGEVDRVCCY